MHNGEKTVSVDSVGEAGYPQGPHLGIHITSKWFKHLCIRLETVKLLEDMGKNYLTLKAQPIKWEKIFVN